MSSSSTSSSSESSENKSLSSFRQILTIEDSEDDEQDEHVIPPYLGNLFELGDSDMGSPPPYVEGDAGSFHVREVGLTAKDIESIASHLATKKYLHLLRGPRGLPGPRGYPGPQGPTGGSYSDDSSDDDCKKGNRLHKHNQVKTQHLPGQVALQEKVSTLQTEVDTLKDQVGVMYEHLRTLLIAQRARE